MKKLILRKVDSVGLNRKFWTCWNIVGIGYNQHKLLWTVYDLLVNFVVTLYCPLHLILGVFTQPTKMDVFKNMSITVTCTICSIQHYALRYRLQEIKVIENLLKILDDRAVTRREREYFQNNTKPAAQRIWRIFLVLATVAHISSILMVLVGKEKRLLFPAWFPFDWHKSELLYRLCLLYQFLAVGIQIIQNFNNDSLKCHNI